MTMKTLKTTAFGGCLAVVLAAVPAAAQQSDSSQSSGQNGQSTQQSGQFESGQSGNGQSAGSQSMSPDTVVATVGGTDILGADIVEFITALPPQMREQPPQMLLSMALDQVILRELLLRGAEEANLGDDSRVTEIVDQNAQIAREDAMVAVFLQDRLSERVTDEEVQQAYEEVQSQTGNGQSLPPLEQVRPQIEQQLQRQELPALRNELAQNIDIVVYGAGEQSSQSGNASSGSGDGSASQGASSDSQ